MISQEDWSVPDQPVERRERWIPSWIFEDNSAGLLVRRALPFVVGVPVALGIALLEAQRAGIHLTGPGVALLSVALIGGLGAALWRAGAAIAEREQAVRFAAEELRRSEARVSAELSDTQLLQSISAALVREDDVDKLYEKIMAAAVAIMGSDFASMQMFYPERGEGGALRLLASHGLSADAVKLWEWVDLKSESSCAFALRTRERILASDLERWDFLAGTAGLEGYRNAGIRAAQSTPLLSRAGKVVGMISTHWRRPHQPTARDLSLLDILARQAADLLERRLAEEALRANEERLRMALEASSTVAWTWDLQTDRVSRSKNSESLLGLPMQRSAALWEVVYPEDLPALRATIEEAIASRGEYAKDVRIVRPTDGKLIWLRHSGKVECDAAGKPVRLAGTLVDITDRKLAEEELRAADRRKDEFLATLSHELRNPLAPIRNAIEVLKNRGSGPELIWARDVIDRQVGQLGRLVDDLMDVARITRNRLELRKQRLAVAYVVERGLEASRPQIDAAGHCIDVSIPSEALWIDADPVRIAQVVSNLLNNAAKYTPRGGQISLRVSREASFVAISVKDTGIGISREHLPHLFEIFAQAEPALERSAGGLGIGLSLVRGIVQAHAGQVEALSAGRHCGSEFVVRLPLAKRQEAAHSLSEGRGVMATVPLRILVADDNADAAETLAMLLQLDGHEVTVAGDGEEAVAAAERERPHVVLLDIGMPRLNGYEAARRLREQPWSKGMALAALTGWGQESDRRRAAQAGFDHHLIKPVDPEGLRDWLYRVGCELDLAPR